MAALTVHLAPPPQGTASHWCLVLHGLGDSHRGWLPVAAMLQIPRLGFAFVDAPMPYADGWSWFDIGHDFSIDLAQVRTSRGAVQETITALCNRVGIDRSQLFLLGFSQGALMVMDVALRSDQAFAGVVAISGFLALLDEYPAQLGPAGARQRLLMTHGRQDPMIPIASVRAQRARLERAGVAVAWQEFDKVHTLDVEEEVPAIRRFLIDGMGSR